MADSFYILYHADDNTQCVAPRCVREHYEAPAKSIVTGPDICKDPRCPWSKYPHNNCTWMRYNALQVKRLDPRAKLPTVATPQEDLGYDVYALEDTELSASDVTRVRTGIAISQREHGFIVKDRSSMAALGIFTHAGVIDEGYRGEVLILLTTLRTPYVVREGQKIAQLIPVKSATIEVYEVDDLPLSMRGIKGFGSSGK